MQQQKHYAQVRYDNIAKALAVNGVKPTWPIMITIEYSIPTKS